MRAVAILALAALVLAGCSSHPAPASPSPTEQAKEPDRLSRGGGGGGSDGGRDEGNQTPHKTVVLLSEPLDLPSQQPVTYQGTVPAGTTNVTFELRDALTYEIDDLKVEVSGCGEFSRAVGSGLYGGGGGGGFGPVPLCPTPQEGAITVTVSTQTSVVVQGTFVLSGEQPA